MTFDAPSGKDAGICRILKRTGAGHSGMAMLVDSRHAITCAHVVNDAIGRPHASQGQIKQRLTVDFPLTASNERREGRVIVWQPMGTQPEFDIAVIELDEDAPESVGFAIFAHIRHDLSHDALSVFGIEAGHKVGKHLVAVLKGPTTSAEVQIDDAKNGGAFVRGGYSGAGVWDLQHEAFVGLVRAVDAEDGPRSAYMTSVPALAGAWADMPLEERGLARAFSRIWTGVAATFLFALAYLFYMSQSAPKDRHPQLALFAGMHLYILGAAMIGWMWKLRARAFRLHPWPSRFPPLAGVRLGTNRRTQEIFAAVCILCFVLAPMYAQGHFIRKFHKQGHVYVYVREFGFTRDELSSAGYQCLGTRLCEHPEAGRYSTVTPRAPADGGYWNDRYHYGDARPESAWGESVTFFPKLQPILIFVLTGLVAVLHGHAAWLTFSGSRRRGQD